MAIEPAVDADTEADGRERSAIRFPYMDLDDALAVARAVHGTTGSTPCAQDQLAAHMDLSIKSSGFQVRLATARLFGLITSAGGVKLTSLGEQINDPSQERGAKVAAFLSVPLYSKLYEHYRGKIIPPAAAFERELQAMGVPQKQTSKARQVFERSAQSAGFFEYGKDKLIAPATGAAPAAKHSQGDPDAGGAGSGAGGGFGSGSGNGNPPDIDPIIQGLLARLPKSGDTWPEAERKLWLQLLEGSFKLIYKDAGT